VQVLGSKILQMGKGVVYGIGNGFVSYYDYWLDFQQNMVDY